MKRKRKTPLADENMVEIFSESTRKELKAKVHGINGELAELARKKLLKQALKTFNSYTSKGLPLDIHAYSSILNAYVRCGDLPGALIWMEKMRKDNIPANIVTYTTLLKGCSEAGLLQSASDIFFNNILSVNPKLYRVLRDKESPELVSEPLANVNVRALNAYLRGCTRVGAVTAALNAYFFYTAAVAAPRPRPDATSFELLIGLLCRAGHLDTAYSMLQQFANKVDPLVAQPELSSVGGSANVSVSVAVAVQANASPTDPLENAAIYLSLAQTCALRGLARESAKWITLTENALQISKSAGLKNAMFQRFQQQVSSSPGSSLASERSDASRKSVKLFLEHREDEIRHRLQLLEDYLAARMNQGPNLTLTVTKNGSNNSSSNSQFHSAEADLLISRSMHAQAQLLEYLSHVLYFGTDGHCDVDLTLPQSPSAAQRDKETKKIESKAHMSCIAGRLVVALKDKCGLKVLTAQQLAEVIGLSDLSVRVLEQYKSFLQAVVRSTIEKVFRSISPETGRIDLLSLFNIKDSDSKECPVKEEVFVDPSGYGLTAEEYGLLSGEVVLAQPPAAPQLKQRSPDINLEIGSGDGEWITAQANASIHTDKKTGQQVTNSYWLAMELRHDRVCNTVNHYLSSLPPPAPPSPPTATATATATRYNLAVLGGDAMKMISERLADSCVSAIFINHPQPPEKILEVKAKGRLSSQGKHLLTEEFFAAAHRVLRYPLGRITIVTDSLQYAQLLAQILVEQVRAAFARATESDIIVQEGGSRVFVSAPLVDTVDRHLEERRVVALDDGASASDRILRSGPLYVEIWRGEPGMECGHVEENASSYFDRMWIKGKKKKRWILFLRPVSLQDM